MTEYDYWLKVGEFMAELSALPWWKPQGEPDKTWLVFDTRRAAQRVIWQTKREVRINQKWYAAWNAVYRAAYDGGRAAARSAASGIAREVAQSKALTTGVQTLLDETWYVQPITTPVANTADVTLERVTVDTQKELELEYRVQECTQDAVLDAMLWAAVLACDGIPLSQKHIDHARARMEVWRRGFGLRGDIGNKLIVYRKP